MSMPKLLGRLMLACLLFSISKGYAQTKPTLTFTVVCYIEEQTANYFGGKAAVQDSIIKQMQGVNQIFNANTGFNSTYNFTPVAFKYYKDGEGLDSTLILTQMAPETNYHYRVVYNAFPPSNLNYRVAYDAGYESIIFSYDNAVYGNGNIFGRVMTKTLAHEFGHSRGAYDLYAGNINGNQNSVNSNLGWNSPEASIMNILFSDNGWDTQSTYMINKTATVYGAHTLTWDQWMAIGNAAFPQTIGVSVAGGNGWPIPNATVKMYGIPWIRDNNNFTLSSTPTYTLTTDNGGLAKFTNNNPFVINAGNLPLYHTFFVTVTYGSETKYAWIPFYEVSNAFVNGQSAYYKNIFVNTNGYNIPPMATVGTSGPIAGYAPLNTAIPFYVYDLDGTIASVKVYDNGTYLGDANFETARRIYWFTPSPLAAGQHAFTAIATDNSGATAQTQVLRIDVSPADLLPSVSLTTPVNHNTYTGTSLTISGTSSDSDGSVSKIELYASGVLLTTITTGTNSFTYTWTNVPKGSYTISARAIDDKKGLGISTAYIKIDPNTCTAPQWNSTVAYVSGNEVVYGGIRYHANWWTQNERPDTHNGGAGSGMPWTSLGACTTRMDATANNGTMELYPNPASETTNVNFTNSVSGSVQIIVSDMLSNPVLTKEISAEAGNNEFNLDVTSLKPGIYVVNVSNGTDRLVKQLVVK